MTSKTTLRTAALVGVVSVSALAVPAVASAHPAVYSQTARVVDVAASGSTPATYKNQERYVVANHGFTYVLRETNGRTATSGGTLGRGVVTYAKAEGKGRQAGFLDSAAATTGAQAHATCQVASLTDEATVRSWQGATAEDAGEPFYAYVPFQTAPAGLEDAPSKWLPVVKAKTGVDLQTVANTDAARKAACESAPVGGTYYPADETQSTVASFNSGLITETKAPFQAQVATLQEQLAAAQAARAAADQSAAAQKARGDAAEGALAQAAGAEAAGGGAGASKPLAATLAERTFTPSGIASSGVPVSVTGPAGQVVRVRATVSAAQARKHGLRSTVLGSKSGVVGQDGTTRVTVKPSAAQGRRLKAAKGSVPVTLELVVGTTKATVAR